MTHANSREAFHEFDHDSREAKVLGVFRSANLAGFTDRNIADILGYPDMNAVRPTITRLTDLGFLHEIGSVVCQTTKRVVRVSSLAPDRSKQQTPSERSITITPEIRTTLATLRLRYPHSTTEQLVHRGLVLLEREGME